VTTARGIAVLVPIARIAVTALDIGARTTAVTGTNRIPDGTGVPIVTGRALRGSSAASSVAVIVGRARVAIVAGVGIAGVDAACNGIASVVRARVVVITDQRIVVGDATVVIAELAAVADVSVVAIDGRSRKTSAIEARIVRGTRVELAGRSGERRSAAGSDRAVIATRALVSVIAVCRVGWVDASAGTGAHVIGTGVFVIAIRRSHAVVRSPAAVVVEPVAVFPEMRRYPGVRVVAVAGAESRSVLVGIDLVRGRDGPARVVAIVVSPVA
jgi:hypothetical protein